MLSPRARSTPSRCSSARAAVSGTPAWSGAARRRPGSSSTPTGAVNATTVPNTPAEFTAAGVSSSEVDLAWDSVTGATGYEVDRQNLDSTWTTLTSSIDSSTTSYADTGLAGGTNFTYRVEALDAGGASAPADPETGLTAPDAPTHVTGTPNGAGEVDLTWDAMTGADTYSVSVSSDGGTHYTSLDSGITDTSYADTTVSGGTHYLYQIVATNVTGDSAPGTSNSALTVPAAQSDFAATPISAGEVDLSWTDVTGATSYTIERKTGAGTYSPITSPALAGNIHSYMDTGVSPATSFTYEIFATDATGNSTTTQSSSVLTVPAAVTIATTTVVSTSEIDLTWTADTGTVSGYRVFRSDDMGGTFSQLGSDLSNSTHGYNDTTLDAATPYIYRVVAFNATGHSGNSDTDTLTSLAETPGDFAVIGVSTSEIDLSWDAVSARPASRSTVRIPTTPGRR